jgi:hypothetical protein
MIRDRGDDEPVRTYRAARSWGRWVLAGVGLATVLPSIPAVMLAPWTLVLTVPVAALFGVMLLWYPTIRYELGPDELVLRFGPMRYPVRLAEIDQVVKKDLAVSMWSSMRLPGFAVFTVYYSDEGNVLMCATRAAKDIVLIRAGKRKYGITPLEEQEFLEDLLGRLKRCRSARSSTFG